MSDLSGGNNRQRQTVVNDCTRLNKLAGTNRYEPKLVEDQNGRRWMIYDKLSRRSYIDYESASTFYKVEKNSGQKFKSGASVRHSAIDEIYRQKKKTQGSKTRITGKKGNEAGDRKLNDAHDAAKQKAKLEVGVTRLNQAAGTTRFELTTTQASATAPKQYKIVDKKTGRIVNNVDVMLASLKREKATLRHSDFVEGFFDYYGDSDIGDMTDLF